VKPGRAFTLVELLVAAALGALLALAAIAAVGGALAHWDRATERLAMAAEAQVVLDQLAADLQGAIVRGDGGTWLAVSVLADTGLSGQWRPAAIPAQGKPGNAHPGTLDLAAPGLERARFGVAGVWLRLLTTKADTGADAASQPAPVAVGWQIVRRSVTSSLAAPQRYLLFRSEVRRAATAAGAPGTFEAGYDLDPAAEPPTAYMTASGTAGDPGNLIRPPLGSAFADDVVDFGVRLYVHEGSNLRLVFPALPSGRGADPPAGVLTEAAPPSDETQHLARGGEPAAGDYYRHTFPDTADIMVRVLTGEGARLIAAYEAGRLRPPAGTAAADYWWTLAEGHSRVFTMRVAIPARPL